MLIICQELSVDMEEKYNWQKWEILAKDLV